MVHLSQLNPRRKFVDRLNHFVHPGEEISNPEQLKGRDGPMLLLRDAFETNGLNAFVWGLRGVGKTSLVHTSCNQFNDTVQLATAIACQRHSTYNELLDDLVRRLINDGKVDVKSSSTKAGLSAFGLSIEGTSKAVRDHIEIRSVNHGSDLLGTIMPADHATRRDWVVIVDEFDQLENIETIEFSTSLAKQISVDKRAVKFVFCGVASNLNDLIGTHESVERYIKAISLDPLSADHIIDISRFIAQNFEVRFKGTGDKDCSNCLRLSTFRTRHNEGDS